jgi:outer membrane protein OmpA-like peptidoglycan-associated protein
LAAGRDVGVNGWIFSEAERSVALEAAAAAPGVRLVADGLSEPLAQDPYLWRAAREGGVVILSGAAPSPMARAALVAAANQAMPTARIVDQMAYMSGAAKNFIAQARVGLQVLAHLSGGVAQLRGGELILSGQGASVAEYRAAVALANRPPEGVTSVKAELSPPEAGALSFEAKKAADSPDAKGTGEAPAEAFSAEKTENALVLKGFYGDDAAHEQILDMARAHFPGLAVTDETQRGAGAGKAFLTAALGGIEHLARLRVGAFGLRGQSASLSGDAGRAETAEEVRTAFIAAMPDGFSVETHVTGTVRESPPAPSQAPAALDPQACQNRLMETVRATPLRFHYRSARLKPESDVVVRALATVAQSCPAAAFEVIGTAEDFIHASYNRNLARRRAGTVIAALAAAGIDARRLIPRKPDDERDEQRAKIGGVEFIVK